MPPVLPWGLGTGGLTKEHKEPGLEMMNVSVSQTVLEKPMKCQAP